MRVEDRRGAEGEPVIFESLAALECFRYVSASRHPATVYIKTGPSRAMGVGLESKCPECRQGMRMEHHAMVLRVAAKLVLLPATEEGDG